MALELAGRFYYTHGRLRTAKAYIQDAHDVNEIVAMGYSKDIVMDVIKRVDRNEYKRHQAAPGLKVTSKAFGYGRRYPIAQRYAARIASD